MTQIWGHRGAMGYYPENTMISFKEAVKQGANGIELDVHLSKDGYLIVCHDERVDRTTNGTGFIKDMTCRELRKLDAGTWFDEKYKGQKLPILREVFDYLINRKIVLNIELKAGSAFYDGIEEKLVKLIENYRFTDKVIISSFDHRALVKVKEINPKIKTGILYVSALYEPIKYLKMVGADALHPYYITIDKNLIYETTKNNIPINTYTVNDMNMVKKLASYNLNAIITNYPDKALKELED